MTPAEVSHLRPTLRPVAEERRLDCVRSRLETFEREGVVEWVGLRWDARFCFDGNRDRLRAVYLAPADGAPLDAVALTHALTTRHGPPLARTADRTLPYVREWRDGATLVTLDTSPEAGWTVTYEASPPASGGRSRPAASAVPPARAVTGEWRYVAPSEGGGAKFGWFEPSVPLEFVGFLLICREGDLRPGQIAVTTQLGGSDRPSAIEVRVSDGPRSATVAGRADFGVDNLALWAVLPGSHPVFGLLAETREDRTLTLSTRQLRQPQRYPLQGALSVYRQFARACGLQAPPGSD